MSTDHMPGESTPARRRVPEWVRVDCRPASPVPTARSCSPTAVPDVIKVEPAEGDPLRRWSASGAHIASGDRRSAVQLPGRFETQRRRPTTPTIRGHRVDQHTARVRGRVVWSRDSRITERPSLDRRRDPSRFPHLTVTAITPFGLTGPWRDGRRRSSRCRPGRAASSGSGRGSPDRAPVHVGARSANGSPARTPAAGTLTSRIRNQPAPATAI